MKAFHYNALGDCLRAMTVACLLGMSVSAQAGTIAVKVVADGKPVDDAVVYVVAVNGTASIASSGTNATMVQEGQQFSPKVLPVQVGTTVQFPNHDPFRHHVYSFAPAKTFELKLYGGGETQSVVFDKEGVVPLGCNIHDQMLAYIFVVGTPHFAKTSDGAGTMANVPAGSYTLRVWHPDQRAAAGTSQPIVVTDDGTVQADVTISLKRGRRPQRTGGADEQAY